MKVEVALLSVWKNLRAEGPKEPKHSMAIGMKTGLSSMRGSKSSNSSSYLRDFVSSADRAAARGALLDLAHMD